MLARARCGSLPTCRTTSRPPCSSPGSPPNHGHRGTTASRLCSSARWPSALPRSPAPKATAGWRTEAKILFDIASSAFVPPPKVTSSLVQLLPRQNPLPCDRRALERVTEAAFGQRRKMLRQSLKQLGINPIPLLENTGIDPTARAEDIPVEGFV